MKKIIIIIIMIITIVWTIPSIQISNHTRSVHKRSTPTKQADPITKQTVLPSSSTDNATNQGLAIENQGKIYYTDGEKLLSTNTDGTFKVKIQGEAYPINIQVINDDIYYINQQTHNIYKVKKDGTQNKKISEDKAYSLNIYNNKMYFIDRYNKLYITQMSLDGSDKQVIKDVVANQMMIYNNFIYYMSEGGDLGRVKLDGTNNMILKTDIMHFDVSEAGIYYIYDPRIEGSPKGLYHLELDDHKETRLLEETPYSFNAGERFIYYNHPSKLSLYRMALDGTKKTQIVGSHTTQINIAGNYIYYQNLEDGKKIYRVNLEGEGRMAINGKTLVSNVIDLTREINELEKKEIVPKLQRTYTHAKEIIDEIIRPEMSDYEKAEIVHDYIINTSSYDVEAAENFLQGKDSDANSFMAYGILINQKGVCQGYAEAAQILLSLAGIESDLVIGEALGDDGEYISHMWNNVRIDDEYYMIDTTWDDPVGPEDIILHDFFLVDIPTLKKTHKWAYDEYPD